MECLRLDPGSVVANRFEIDRIAGSGGMGTVYRARDRYSGSAVALKLMHSNMGGPSEAERFVREAELLAELHHPGIVSHVAHGQSPDGLRFLAMEWLDGEDLGHRLARGRLPVQQCLTLLTGVVSALAAAHQRGVIHRDLKPANIFLMGSAVENPKLLDFGIARRLAPSTAMTRTGMIVGTPEYMAPEQARGWRDLTPAADLFSLGCILYECLTGEPPFVGDHLAAILARILFEEPIPVEDRCPGVPALLLALLNKLLCKDPTQRFADAVVLQAELSALAKTLAAAAESTLVSTVASPAFQQAAFADSEQNLVSIVLAAAAEVDPGVHATLPSSALLLEEAAQQKMLQAISALGASPNFLMNGTLVVTLPSQESARDQARQGARVGMLVKQRWPQATVVLATGRGTVKGRLAAGEVVEQAARILRSGTGSKADSARVGVFADSLSSSLLQGQFAQTPRPDGGSLLAEEKEADASRPLLGKPTPCVGRDVELVTLEAELAGCIDASEARAILITAPPGGGKSRLRHEFLRRVERRTEPLTTLLGRGDLLSAGAAYQVVARALRTVCEILESETLAEQRQRLRQRMRRLLPAADEPRILPFLGELCGVPFPEEQYPLLREARQTPKVLPERLRRAGLAWLAAECQAAPVLFILDDLHWSDELTVALLDDALLELQGAPLFIVALARPEVLTVFPSLVKRHRLHEMALKPLSKRACERLVVHALGKNVSPESVALIMEQSAGNALFLEELIRAAADGQLANKPETVVAMLQARIGHLDPGARRAVLAASVFGQTSWDGGIASVLGVAKLVPELDGWLRVLTEAELLEPHRSSLVPDQREYGFRHALVRDAAYGFLTEEDKKLGHQRAAEFLQERADKQIPIATLAYHFRQAASFDKALQYYLKAGDQATKLFQFEEARLHYEAASESLQRLPSTPILSRLKVGILLKQVQCSVTAIAPEINEHRLACARQIIESLQSEGRGEPEDLLHMARIDYYCGRLHFYNSQNDLAESFFHRVNIAAKEFNDIELSVLAPVYCGIILMRKGLFAKSIELLENVISAVEGYLGKDIETVRAYTFLAMALAQGGRGRDALRLIEHIEPWAAEVQQLSYSIVLNLNTCGTYCFARDFSAALLAGERALESAEKANDIVFRCVSLDLMAWSHNQVGRHEEALNYRKRAVELRRLHNSRSVDDFFIACHADILLNLGQTTAAAELAAQVATTARQSGSMGALIEAERVWGCALARLGAEPEEVEVHLRESLSSADCVGATMEAMRTEIAWGRVCLARGDGIGARAHFQQAKDRLTDQMLSCARNEFLQLAEQGLQDSIGCLES